MIVYFNPCFLSTDVLILFASGLYFFFFSSGIETLFLKYIKL